MLGAVLAFALAMVVFSTLVTAVVEALFNRVFSLRRRLYRSLLERFFDDYIWKRFQELLEAGSAELTADKVSARRRFVAVVGHDSQFSADECEKRLASRRPLFRYPLVEWQTPIEFAERLAETRYADAIEDAAPDRLQSVIDDLARKYEKFGANAQKRFADQARIFSVIVAIAFCFVANVEAGRLFTGFLHDEKLTESFLASSESFLKTAKDTALPDSDIQDEIDAGLNQIERVQDEIVSLRDAGLPIGYDYFPGCTVVGVPFSESDGNEQYKGEKARTLFVDNKNSEELRLFTWKLLRDDPSCLPFLRSFGQTESEESPDQKAVDSNPIKEIVCELRVYDEAGKPTGADFAACAQAYAENAAGWGTVLKRVCSPEGFEWLALVVLAGLLVGLGSPFWYDFFTGFMRIRNLLGSFSGATARTAPKAGEGQKVERQDVAPGNAPVPATPGEAFTNARDANVAISPGRTGYLILEPDGTSKLEKP